MVAAWDHIVVALLRRCTLLVADLVLGAIALAEERDAPVRVCHLCGHQGSERFCPRCLADTMVALPRS